MTDIEAETPRLRCAEWEARALAAERGNVHRDHLLELLSADATAKGRICLAVGVSIEGERTSLYIQSNVTESEDAILKRLEFTLAPYLELLALAARATGTGRAARAFGAAKRKMQAGKDAP